MAYPNTSAQDIAEKQSEIDGLRALLKEWHSSATAYTSIEHPVPKEEADYFQRTLDLLQRTEDLIPELVDEYPGDEESHEWGADHSE